MHLPRAADLVQDVLQLASDTGQQWVRFYGTDVADAFHQIPLHPDEWRFVCTSLGGKYYCFKCVVFGAASAPITWARYAAFLGRSTAAVTDPSRLRQEIYVDDPAFVVAGPEEEAAQEVAIALFWATLLGFLLAGHKTDGGEALTWIGAHFEIRLLEVKEPSRETQ